MKAFLLLLCMANTLLASPLGRSGIWLTNHTGAVLLTGHHTWNDLQDFSNIPNVNWTNFLATVVANRENYVRLWQLDSLRWSWFPIPTGDSGWVSPLPWNRPGPGTANDGTNKLDLTSFNQTYFDRLSNYVAYAQSQGVFVSVMLFESTTPSAVNTNFTWSPYNTANNINGGLASVNDMYLLSPGTLTNAYRLYVDKVVDTVNGFDNVLYEVINEALPKTTNFQFWVINRIHAYEATKPKQHPVIMSALWSLNGEADNNLLRTSPADMLTLYGASPDASYNNRIAPNPQTNTTYHVGLDTDHLWGIGGNVDWQWKAFLRGYSVFVMTPLDHYITTIGNFGDGMWRAAGDIGWMSRMCDLKNMTPSATASSTGYALVNSGQEYLIYQPDAASFTVTMTTGWYDYLWFDTGKRKIIKAGKVEITSTTPTFTIPIKRLHGLVLRLKRA